MAAAGAEVIGSWFLWSGPVTFFILLLLLSIFLTALCSDCRRHSFELQDSEADKTPPSLVRVVKLEEAMGARENPAIDDIQNDEAAEEHTVSFTPWRSHLGAPQNHEDVQTNGSTVMKTTKENAVPFTPWRSHLGAPQSHDLNSSIRGQPSSGDGNADVSSPPTNPEADGDRNAVYAQVSKKVRPTTPPVHTPEEDEEDEEDKEDEESSPPLPDRKPQLER